MILMNKLYDDRLILNKKSYTESSSEEISEPIQNALYATDRLTTDQCTDLAEGILIYLKDSDFKVVKQLKNGGMHEIYQTNAIRIA